MIIALKWNIKKQIKKQITKTTTALDTIETMRIEGDLTPARYRERKPSMKKKWNSYNQSFKKLKKNPLEKSLV